MKTHDRNNIPLALAFAALVLSLPIIQPAQADSFVNTGSLNTSREDHTATLLANGKVLVAGGYSSGYLSSAELDDPSSGTGTNTGSLNTARYRHKATLLPKGKVLVAGGVTANAELYLWSAYVDVLSRMEAGSNGVLLTTNILNSATSGSVGQRQLFFPTDDN